jgi:PIN domain nuclease of toxin-antitoxin system
VPLLDTHAWIWWIEGDRRLPRRVRDTLDQLPSFIAKEWERVA